MIYTTSHVKDVNKQSSSVVRNPEKKTMRAIPVGRHFDFSDAQVNGNVPDNIKGSILYSLEGLSDSTKS